jgi:predicted adenylyl cyclase CyaB
MPTNVEIKARLRNLRRHGARAAAISALSAQICYQHDTFFNVPNGLLKLREQTDTCGGELIFYQRDNTAGPRPSVYSVSKCEDPGLLRTFLAYALGVRGEVRKRRIVYLAGQTRIHFDQVEDLGAFMELEVVLRQQQTWEEGRIIAQQIMKQLEISEHDLIPNTYCTSICSPYHARDRALKNYDNLAESKLP